MTGSVLASESKSRMSPQKNEMEFTIVGSTEADPFEGKISNESEVGKSLLGKQKGETVEILVPDGTLEYKIIDITK